jgi:predicted aspartyl protease
MTPFNIKSFTVEASGIVYVLISKVHISPPRQSAPNAELELGPDCKEFEAIWDTGASGTVITEKVVKECGLKPTGVVEVHTAKGKMKSDTYFVDVWLPNHVTVSNATVTLGELTDNKDVLIGMNIINAGDFAVSNFQGKTVFTFRFPSVERIDFVAKPFKVRPALSFPKRRKR